MKLKHCGVSYNGQRLAEDEFAFCLKPGAGMTPDGVDAIIFPCAAGKIRNCQVKLTLGAPDQAAARWHWNGDMNNPTISPSIGCDVPPRCGWHGHITNGEIT